MNTPINKFGSNCSVSDKFIEKVAKLGVMETAISLTEIKDNHTAKKTDGVKTRTIRGIPKLIDANYAGTASSFGTVGSGDRDIYIKKIDSNTEGVFTKIWKNGAAVEVQIA